MKNLGHIRTWNENNKYPKEFFQCQENEHEVQKTKFGNITRNECPICGIYWEYDNQEESITEKLFKDNKTPSVEDRLNAYMDELHIAFVEHDEVNFSWCIGAIRNFFEELRKKGEELCLFQKMKKEKY